MSDTFFEVTPNTWPALSQAKVDVPKEEWQNDQEKKKLFGIELAKNLKAFEAGLVIFPKDANKALWISHYWITDPVVIASRDMYTESVETKSNLLDKDALAVKLLEFADERAPQGFYINEPKDRLAALRLYAEVREYIGKKVDVNNSTNNFVNNKLELVIVKSPVKKEEPKIIDNEPEELPNKLPLNLKLVKTVNS